MVYSYGLAFILNQKWKNKIYKLGKVDGRIPILTCKIQEQKTKKNRDMNKKRWF